MGRARCTNLVDLIARKFWFRSLWFKITFSSCQNYFKSSRHLFWPNEVTHLRKQASLEYATLPKISFSYFLLNAGKNIFKVISQIRARPVIARRRHTSFSSILREKERAKETHFTTVIDRRRGSTTLISRARPALINPSRGKTAGLLWTYHFSFASTDDGSIHRSLVRRENKILPSPFFIWFLQLSDFRFKKNRRVQSKRVKILEPKIIKILPPAGYARGFEAYK